MAKYTKKFRNLTEHTFKDYKYTQPKSSYSGQKTKNYQKIVTIGAEKLRTRLNRTGGQH